MENSIIPLYLLAEFCLLVGCLIMITVTARKTIRKRSLFDFLFCVAFLMLALLGISSAYRNCIQHRKFYVKNPQPIVRVEDSNKLDI